jgi:hypothetical protein
MLLFTVPTALLQDGGEAESVHPLHHELASVRREVVRTHVRVFCLEGELAVHTVLRRAGRDLVRWQQDRPQQLLLFGTCGTDILIYVFLWLVQTWWRLGGDGRGNKTPCLGVVYSTTLSVHHTIHTSHSI